MIPEQNIHTRAFIARIIFSIIVVATVAVYAVIVGPSLPRSPAAGADSETNLENRVVPQGGITLPITWDGFGAKMTRAGVIDGRKFESLSSVRGALDGETKNLLYGTRPQKIRMTPKNAGVLLNLFWAFGLANKNEILEKGPMADSRYGGPGNFASTGGWTMAKGDAMNYYSRYAFVALTPDQQAMVERTSKGIYRPCCDNPVYFPDCNHGMAMLGLLELMASEGVSEKEMYRVALQANAYWFPDTYLTIAQYLALKNIPWEKADPKKILGKNYSSSSGYRALLSQIAPKIPQGGGGCNV